MPNLTDSDRFPVPVGPYLLVEAMGGSSRLIYVVLDAAPNGLYRAGDVILLDNSDPTGEPWAATVKHGERTAAYVHRDRVVAVVAHAGPPDREMAESVLWQSARDLCGISPRVALSVVAGVLEAAADLVRDSEGGDADLSDALGPVARAIGGAPAEGPSPADAEIMAALDAGRRAMEQAASVAALLPALDAAAGSLGDAMTVANHAKVKRGTPVGASLQAEADEHLARGRGELLRSLRELRSIVGAPA